MASEQAAGTTPAPAGGPLPFRHRHPDWLLARPPWGGSYRTVETLVRGAGLHTVCEEARCPNIGECWGCGTATFLILGDVCTRDCRFCAVVSGVPLDPDPGEAERVARAAAAMHLRHVVITSVTRDDLADGGASAFAECIRRCRDRVAGATIEVLVPDFGGSAGALSKVLASGPTILNHNVETVPRLYSAARSQADYRRSLDLLARAKALAADVVTKSGLMVGLGETVPELVESMHDLASARVDILSIGQYLRPTEGHLPIHRYYSPAEFEALARLGREAGLRWVEAGPLVRSSYRAAAQARLIREADEGAAGGVRGPTA